MKLIQGLEIYSLKTVTKNYKFIHYENDEIEIRSIHPKESIVDISILKTILPGNLGSFIYPHDAIICYKNRLLRLCPPRGKRAKICPFQNASGAGKAPGSCQTAG